MMIITPWALLVFFFMAPVIVNAQLAAMYSKADQSSECSNWSSWGPCVWPDKNTTSSYVEQLGGLCQKHWFFTFIKLYQTALDNFYNYMRRVLKSEHACGLCSYKQSCGYGGAKKCHQSPFSLPEARSIIPFFVSERVCNARDLEGKSQVDSCVVDYDLLMENGSECQLWPAPSVDLSSLSHEIQAHISALKWYSCLPQIRKFRKGKGKTKSYRYEKSCRCCCFPFKPNPKTFKCEYAPGLPEAPGQSLLKGEL